MMNMITKIKCVRKVGNAMKSSMEVLAVIKAAIQIAAEMIFA